MPELPEVEIIKLFLAQNIVGLKVKTIEVLNRKSFTGDPDLLIGKQIKTIERRAKVLRIGFGDLELLIHLKMSGQLILIQNSPRKNSGQAKIKMQKHNSKLKNKERFIGGHPTQDMKLTMPNKSTRAIFNFTNGSKLFFNDQRKFGWIRLVTGNKLESNKLFEKIGPEPLDKSFTWELLKDRLSKRKKTPIKVALLDQQVLAGVGNIYACEACFLAGIDPRKKVLDLTDSEFKNLHRAVVEALRNGIKYGGSSKTHFMSPEGKKGLFLDFAFVYGRDKLPCKKCGNPIKKIKLGGRGTYFCPVCQVD